MRAAFDTAPTLALSKWRMHSFYYFLTLVLMCDLRMLLLVFLGPDI